MSKKIVDKKLLQQPKSFKKIYGLLRDNQFDLCFDSRKMEEGQSFFALRGENFDGSSFIPQVLKKKCPLIISEDTPAIAELAKNHPDTCFVICENAVTYLQELAHLHMLEWKRENPKRIIIGITGSNGKTTTKEMLSHFLSAALPGKVIFTQGNLNNHLGVPFTLLTAQKEHQILIVEMGTNHPGEIKLLCDLAKPDAGIITSIGPAHLEFFGTVENIFLEKKNLFDSVVENTHGQGHFVLNKEDSYLSQIKPSKGLKSFGESSGDFKISLSNQTVTIDLKTEKITLENENLIGAHNFRNLVASFLMAFSLYPEEKEKFIVAAKSFKPTSNRSSWIEKGNKKFFLDAYNANPGSMKASLEGFVQYLKKSGIPISECFFILGDMNELGENAPSLHQEIGLFLKNLGASEVAFIGRFSEHYRRGFGGEKYIFDSKKSFEKDWDFISKKFKYFFIKASRSLQLESILDIN
jgi:UDP-N-acetylmuramoyl-tripeptide--D-alanyl-D-alanine ligase